MLDGAMARERGGGTRFGAVLDATCDRISDGAVFCGLLWWAAFGLHSAALVVATLICLVTSQVISYIKARAEASGLCGDGGLIERPERLVIVLVGAGAVRPGSSGAVAAARRDVGARGGQPGHPGQRLHTVRTSPGAMDPLQKTDAPGETERRGQPTRAERARRPSRRPRSAAAASRWGPAHRLGLRRGLAAGACDAGVRGAQRVRRRSASTPRAAADPNSCARTWPG